MTQLRPYQQIAIDHLRRGLEAGVWRQYIELPTGTGKSTIAAAFAEQRQALGRVLALVHRQDLAQQLANTFRREDLEVGLLMEGERILHSPVVVATVQSLTPAATQDLLAASPVPIRTVLIDEAHHAVPGSDYERILTDVEHAAGEQMIVSVGMTATPYRTDEKSMLDLLHTCTFARTIPEMVRQGYLAPLTWQPVQIDLNLDEVATKRQDGELDYTETTLARHLMHGTITERIVGYAASHIGQRPTLVFAVTVQHAHQLSEAFCARGYTTAVVSGGTRRKRREDIFARWRAGAIQVICNCALLTEGFDYPEVAAVVIARPTLSPVLYMQMVGRGMRKAEGKSDCLVVDVVGNQPDPGLQVVLPHVVGIQEQPVDERHREQQAGRRKANRLLRFVLGGQGETELALLDPLGRSHYRWNDFRGGYFATINDHTIAIIDRDPTESGLCRSRLCTQPPGQPADHHWIEERLLPLRQQIALLHEATRGITHEHLAGKEAPWLNRPASEKQLKMLSRYDKRLPEWAHKADWTQRDASAAITYYRWRWVLLHPPPLRKNRRTRNETLARDHTDRGTPHRSPDRS